MCTNQSIQSIIKRKLLLNTFLLYGGIKRFLKIFSKRDWAKKKIFEFQIVLKGRDNGSNASDKTSILQKIFKELDELLTINF